MFTPFSGWLFDAAAVADPGLATSPPYDVITERDRAALLARSPFNIVRLLLPGKSGSDTAEASRLLRRWGTDGTLRQDESERFYLYETEYRGTDGVSHTTTGVIGALELREFDDGVVPHEETMRAFREDRLAVLRATRANLDPIIALSAAPELPALLSPPAAGPRVDFTEPDGSHHRLFEITDPEAIAALTAAVSGHPVAIADGHHRYSTALAYRKEREAADGSGPWGCIMALLAPAEGSGMVIGPYHRALRDLRSPDLERAAVAFEITRSAPLPPTEAGHLVLVSPSGAHHLAPRAEQLRGLAGPHRQSSTAVAEALLYPALATDESSAWYTADADEAIAVAAESEGTAVLVAPLPEHAVAEAGELGLRFPTKSTYFTPKPRAGLVLRWFGAAD